VPLADDLRQLRDRTLGDLTAAHDYYADTKTAWKIVRREIATGGKITIDNWTTGSVTTEADLARKVRGYVRRQLAEATFQQFVSIFETYLIDLLRLWLTVHPESLGGKKVDFRTVLEAADKDAITAAVVGKELNELAYEKPAGWFAYLNQRVALDCPSADQIERIAEAKATRDVLVHKHGVANATYLAKAGPRARCEAGERIELAEHNHRQTWELFHAVVDTTSAAAIAKAE
jgi:hypothetical protein